MLLYSRNTVFRMRRFICFKELRNFASEICQQKFLRSKGTCPMGFLFLSLSLTRSSPLSVVPFIWVRPHTGKSSSLLSLIVPNLSWIHCSGSYFSMPCHFLVLLEADYFCIYYFTPYLSSCLALVLSSFESHILFFPFPINMVTEYIEK